LTTALGLLALVALIAANGYFVAAEFGFVAVHRNRMEQEARAGGRAARRVLDVSRRLSFMLSGAQLGITATSLLAGYLAEPAIGRVLEPLFEWAGLTGGAQRTLSFLLAFFLATTAQMIFGELAPKNLAIAKPESVAKALAGSVHVYLTVAGPVIRLFDGAANRLLRALGIEPAEELATGVSAEELDYIVEQSVREGALTERQAALLSRTIDFLDLQASEVMVPRTRVETLPAAASGAEIRARLRTPYTRYPVVPDGGDLDDVIGVVHTEDLLSFPVERRDRLTAAGIMRPALFVPESAPVTAVVDQLLASRAEMAIVVDEYGGAAGILTMEDLAEELVGDIVDEHDPVEVTLRAVGERCWVVPGSWRIDEIERDTDVVLPDGEYDTIAGLVMDRLGRVPVTGDVVELDGATLHVLDMRRRQVLSVRMTAHEPPSTDAEGGER
jgi:CBS domain containing-hemolysin-like protein